MGGRRNVLDSQAIRDFEDMRLQRSDDPGRWPRYDVELDEADEAARRNLGALVPDIVTCEMLDAASAPPGLGEDFTVSNISSRSWTTEAEGQRALARVGKNASHAVQTGLRGSYPDVVRAVVESLALHGHKLLVLAETDTGLRINAYVPRPWYGGAAGRMTLELALPLAETAVVEVEAGARCEGTMGKWTRGRTALQGVLASADAFLRGEPPSAPSISNRLVASLRPEDHLQWAWLALAVALWVLLALVALVPAEGGGGSVLGVVTIMIITACALGAFYLWIKVRYL